MDDVQKKKLLYRANYRGFKEADLLLGGYLKAHIDSMSDDELHEFEFLLSAKDHDIYDWITGRASVPANFDTPLIDKLRQYRPEF